MPSDDLCATRPGLGTSSGPSDVHRQQPPYGRRRRVVRRSPPNAGMPCTFRYYLTLPSHSSSSLSCSRSSITRRLPLLVISTTSRRFHPYEPRRRHCRLHSPPCLSTLNQLPRSSESRSPRRRKKRRQRLSLNRKQERNQQYHQTRRKTPASSRKRRRRKKKRRRMLLLTRMEAKRTREEPMVVGRPLLKMLVNLCHP